MAMGAESRTRTGGAARQRRPRPRLFVGSETGRLRRVILHRPDLELKRLTPRNKDALLFDDVLWVRRARQEHDAFADALADRDVEVLYLESLLADPERLTTVLTYHVVLGRVTVADAAGLASAPTVQGDELPISTDGGIHVADANVVSPDIEAANGVIHVIDRVLLPAAA